MSKQKKISNIQPLQSAVWLRIGNELEPEHKYQWMLLGSVRNVAWDAVVVGVADAAELAMNQIQQLVDTAAQDSLKQPSL